MNKIDASAALMVDWVDLKWLMAAEGFNLDLDRLCRDPAYGVRCVELALASAQQPLRRLALKLRARSLAVAD